MMQTYCLKISALQDRTIQDNTIHKKTIQYITKGKEKKRKENKIIVCSLRSHTIMRVHARGVRVLSCERNSINDFLFLKYLINQRSGNLRKKRKKLRQKRKEFFIIKRMLFPSE